MNRPASSAPAAAPTAAKPAAEASKPTKPEPAANKEPENEQDAATAEAKKADAAADEAEHEEQSIEERIEILKTNVKVLAGEPVTDLKHDVEEAGQRVHISASTRIWRLGFGFTTSPKRKSTVASARPHGNSTKCNRASRPCRPRSWLPPRKPTKSVRPTTRPTRSSRN